MDDGSGMIASDDGEIDWIEIPIQTRWPKLNEWVSCIVENVDEDGMLPVIRTPCLSGASPESGVELSPSTARPARTLPGAYDMPPWCR